MLKEYVERHICPRVKGTRGFSDGAEVYVLERERPYVIDFETIDVLHINFLKF